MIKICNTICGPSIYHHFIIIILGLKVFSVLKVKIILKCPNQKLFLVVFGHINVVPVTTGLPDGPGLVQCMD